MIEMTEGPKIYTVSEFNRLAQRLLEENFAEVWIEGEGDAPVRAAED